MNTPTLNKVLGQGLKYPVEFVQGKLATSEGVENVQDGIRYVLDTPTGSRFMLPAFGTRVHRLLFEGISMELLSVLKIYVEEDILTWIPRIERVEATPIPLPEQSRVDCKIRYWLRGRPDPQSMVYPFYLDQMNSSTI